MTRDALEQQGTPGVTDEHPVVRAVVRKDEGVELLRVIQVEMARAAAELRFLDDHRDEYKADELLERGRDITRHVRALRRLAELECTRVRRFGRPPLRLDHPLVRQAVALLVERIIEVAHEVLPTASVRALEPALREGLALEPNVPWP